MLKANLAEPTSAQMEEMIKLQLQRDEMRLAGEENETQTCGEQKLTGAFVEAQIAHARRRMHDARTKRTQPLSEATQKLLAYFGVNAPTAEADFV